MRLELVTTLSPLSINMFNTKGIDKSHVIMIKQSGEACQRCRTGINLLMVQTTLPMLVLFLCRLDPTALQSAPSPPGY